MTKKLSNMIVPFFCCFALLSCSNADRFAEKEATAEDLPVFVDKSLIDDENTHYERHYDSRRGSDIRVLEAEGGDASIIILAASTAGNYGFPQKNFDELFGWVTPEPLDEIFGPATTLPATRHDARVSFSHASPYCLRAVRPLQTRSGFDSPGRWFSKVLVIRYCEDRETKMDPADWARVDEAIKLRL